jgi:MFS family permease
MMQSLAWWRANTVGLVGARQPFAAHAAVSLGTSVANVALPTLTEAFGVSFQAAQWIVLAYLLATTTLIVSVGRLGDIIGRRRLLLSGLVLFTVASVLCGVAPDLWVLIAARAAQGLGAAIMMALSLAFVGATVPKDKTGSAMGLLGTMSAVGTALGPSLGGVLIAGLGWRAIFLVNVPLAVTALLFAHRFLPADRRGPTRDKVGFDTPGTLLLALMLGAYALAITIGRGRFGSLNIALLAAAISGLACFVFWETKAASPLIRLGMFRDPVLRAGLAMSALVSTVMMATLVVGPFYLARALGLGAAGVGIVMSVGPLVVAFSGVPAGRVVDRLGAGRMTIIGLVAMAAGSVMLSLLPATLGHPWLHRAHCRHHPRLCRVPDGQQHCRDEGCAPGSAGRDFRYAQPVAQPRADHRRIGAGRGLRAGIGTSDMAAGASRGMLPPVCGSRSPSQRR